jgi:hypothetical protein
MMKKKLLGLLIALILIFGVLGGCGAQRQAEEPVIQTAQASDAAGTANAAILPAKDTAQETEQASVSAAIPESAASPAIDKAAVSEAPILKPTPAVPSSEDSKAAPETVQPSKPADAAHTVAALLPEDGTYTTKQDVALYIHQYAKLPQNFITKKDAQALGWSGGSLEPYAPGKCIGGSSFGNFEGLLPSKTGREYYECDIDTLGASSRGAKRIVYSNDGLIYYTDDHYESFTLLYGDEST